MRPNTRWFIKGNAKVWATIHRDGRVAYKVLEMGRPNEPYDGCPALKAKFANGVMVDLRMFDAGTIADLAQSISNANQFSEEWPTGTRILYVEGYAFYVDARGNLLSCTAKILGGDHVEFHYVPEVMNSSGGGLMRFPLTEDQVIDLLGPADSIYNFYKR